MKYNSINQQIRKEVRYAREEWYLKKCKFVEELFDKHDAFNLHKEIRDMVGINKQTNKLVDENGLPVLDMARKKCIWEQYISTMFADNSRSAITPPTNDTNDGHSILREEVWKALKRAKSDKAVGPDNIHVEVLKLIKEDHIDALVGLMNLVYETGELPKDWLISTFVTLPKKKNAKKCE